MAADDKRKFQIIDELQSTASEVHSLAGRLDNARQRQRNLIVEAVDDLGLRLSLVAQVTGLSPQRIHSLKESEIERRKKAQNE